MVRSRMVTEHRLANTTAHRTGRWCLIAMLGAILVPAACAAQARATVTVSASGPLTTGYVGASQPSTTVSAVDSTTVGIWDVRYGIDHVAPTISRASCTAIQHTGLRNCPSS